MKKKYFEIQTQILFKSIVLLIFFYTSSASLLQSQVINDFPYLEDFETSGDEFTSDFPEGWVVDSLSIVNQFNLHWVILDEQANSGIKSAFIPGIVNYPNDDWLISPPIAVKENHTYNISFWYRTGGFSAPQIFLHLGDQPSHLGMDNIPLWNDMNVDNIVYEQVVVEHTAEMDDTIYLGFHALTPVPDITNFLLDDISIEEIPPITSNSNVFNDKNLKIYPNPAFHTINISTLVSAPDYFELFDIQGKLMLSGKIETNDLSINTSNLNSGTYFVAVYANKILLSTNKILILKE